MKEYKIDFTTNTVVITKAFAQKAAVYGSAEFKMMNDLRRQGFSVKCRTHAKPKKQKPSPSYTQMEQYISLVEESEVYLAQYRTICQEAESHNNKYFRVRQWFSATFPSYGKIPEFTDDGKIQVVPENHDAKNLKIA